MEETLEEKKLKIFDEETFATLTQTEQQQQLKTIQVTFHYRRANYNQLRNEIVDIERFIELSNRLVKFEEEFGPWNQKLQTAINNKNIAQAITFFKEGNTIYEPMEKFYIEILPEALTSGFSLKSLATQLESTFNTKANELLEQQKKDIKAIQTQINEKIQNGIDDVLNLKNELKITGTFKERIETQLSGAPEKVKLYFILFIVSVILLSVLLVSSFFIDTLKDLEWYASLAVRASIALPLFWISQTLYSNYKFYRVAEMKYDHLDRLLGGGVSEITRMIDDPEAKSAAYHKLSELFLDINDLSGIVASEKHPTHKSIAEATEIIKQVRAISKDIVKPEKKESND
ncbi:hypothetical protein PF327_09900 [Sulfurovum sp. XTW-4]|uniref:Uncharacterized protein n=1 Tax=Sulfurovum xiamenensis TaxID=3019066 RepID=A0ABT7QTV3_9BACT|nr:hypothetical protein [Sulfurovum xiamenensis]MDM5264508.1 hypothetical protein [Sulfurovum xiamenensis]